MSAPTIHVTVLKANTGTTSGFTNFVFEPYIPGRLRAQPALQPRRDVRQVVGDARRGRHRPVHPATWAEVIAKNPDATISAISIDNGGSSGNTIPADQFAAGVDNVIVGFGSDFTRYDFGG